MAPSAVEDLKSLLYDEDIRALDSAVLRLEDNLSRVSSLHVAEGTHLVSAGVCLVQKVFDKQRIDPWGFPSWKILQLLRKCSKILQVAYQLLNSFLERKEVVKNMEPCVLLFIADTIRTCQAPITFFLSFFKPVTVTSVMILHLIRPQAADISDSLNILLFRVFKSFAFQHPQLPETHTFLNMFNIDMCFGPWAPTFNTVFSGTLLSKIQSKQENLRYLLEDDGDCCAICGEDKSENFAVLDSCFHTLCVDCSERCFMSKVHTEKPYEDDTETRCPVCRIEIGAWTTSDIIQSETKNGTSPMNIAENKDLILPIDPVDLMIASVKSSNLFSPSFLENVKAPPF